MYFGRDCARWEGAAGRRSKGKPLLAAGGGKGYLESVVRPATEFQHARLLVEREKFHVDLARRFEYGRWFPFNQPYVVYGRLGGQRHVEISVGAADHIQIHKIATTTTKKKRPRRLYEYIIIFNSTNVYEHRVHT